ncbi:MAG TPA: aminotransferase class I/II-fold pyridoxal phosphate-dependent enzyme [Ignavibacteriaceae bacterium]|nr:aminotransferase class I/II-fold pyridoxal phosphate-dependent enzyme [Ignavibacteriaceae bacterium]
MKFAKRLDRLPPYLFAELNAVKLKKRQQGIDMIDLGMGNPDQATPKFIIDKLKQTIDDSKTHRYSRSQGIPGILKAISRKYKRDFDVDIDPEKEAVATIGSKEGLAHLCLATLDAGDVVLVPNPTYPIHIYGVIAAGANVISIPLSKENNFVPDLSLITRDMWPQPKMLILNFPANPTTAVVDLDYLKEIVAFAKKRDMIIVHDMAYSDIVFDGTKVPSILQVPGAKEVAVEFFTMSKSYNMAGWRVGFCVGNELICKALAKLKSFYDYGIFTPIQVAAIAALDSPPSVTKAIAEVYTKRRDVLVEGLNAAGWNVQKPKASMFVWAEIPDKFKDMGSLQFSKMLIDEAEVVTSPGVAFGEYGEGYLRISMVENEQRIRQAVRNIKKLTDK